MGLHPQLPVVERILYGTYYLSYIGICLFELYRESARHSQLVGQSYLVEGWILPNSWKDDTDTEWNKCISYLKKTWRWLLAFVVMSRLVEGMTRSRVWLQRFQLGFSLVWWYSLVDKTLFLIFLSVCVLSHVVCITRSRIVVWVFALLCYTVMNIDSLVYSLPSNILWILFYAGMPLCARNASFGLEACHTYHCSGQLQSPARGQQGRWTLGENLLDNSPAKRPSVSAKHKKDDNYEEMQKDHSRDNASRDGDRTRSEKKQLMKGDQRDESQTTLHEEDFSLETHLHYVYYFPAMYAGPLMNFNDFRLQFKNASQTWGAGRLARHIFGVSRVLLWVVVNELILELFHFYILNQQPELLKTVSLHLLLAIGYMLGQFFMNKYVVIFGLGREVAKFDGLQLPEGPKCISYIYRYTRMWKWFDNGLYQFLKRYIFLPLGGSHSGMVRRLMSSALCFSFIILWHGKEQHIVVWVFLNFAEALLEMLGDILSRTQPVKNLESRLSPQSVRRLHALLFVPLLFMSWISIFFFFGESEHTGIVYLNRTALTSTWKEFGEFFFFHYTFIQVSMDVENYLHT